MTHKEKYLARVKYADDHNLCKKCLLNPRAEGKTHCNSCLKQFRKTWRERQHKLGKVVKPRIKRSGWKWSKEARERAKKRFAIKHGETTATVYMYQEVIYKSLTEVMDKAGIKPIQMKG